MATKMTAHGVSTTTTPGTEQYEVFYTGYRTQRKKHYQYDYRHANGELFYEQYNIMESHIYNLLSYQDFMQIKLSIILLSI